MAWTIKGEFVEACSCNMLCPCWYGVQDLMIMDQRWCASPWLLRIEEGESNGVDISGCNVALVSHWLSTQITDINVFEDNGTIKAEVGEFGSIVSTRMVNEVGDTVALHDAGFALV